jgi:hypothetical protein
MSPVDFEAYVDGQIQEGIKDLDPALGSQVFDTVVSSYRNGLLNSHTEKRTKQLEALNAEVAQSTIIGDYESGADRGLWFTNAQAMLDDKDTRAAAHKSIMETVRLAAAQGDLEFLEQVKDYQSAFRKNRPIGSFIPQDSLDEFTKLYNTAKNVEETIDIEDNLNNIYDFNIMLDKGTLTFEDVLKAQYLTKGQKREYTHKLTAQHSKRELEAEHERYLVGLIADPNRFAQADAKDQGEANEVAMKTYGISDYSNMTPEAEAKMLNYINRQGPGGIPKSLLNYINKPALGNEELLGRQIDTYRKLRTAAGTGDLIPTLGAEATTVFMLADAAENLGVPLDEVTQKIRDSETIRDMSRAKQQFMKSGVMEKVNENLIRDGGFAFFDSSAVNFDKFASDIAYIGAMFQGAGVGLSDEDLADKLVNYVRRNHSTVDDFNGGQDIVLPPLRS